MSEKPTRKQKKSANKTDLFSPKKNELMNEMIMNPYEASIPSSYYDLRPINEDESINENIFVNQNEKSASMEEISYKAADKMDPLYEIYHGESHNFMVNKESPSEQSPSLLESVSDKDSHKGIEEGMMCYKRDTPVGKYITSYEKPTKIQMHEREEKIKSIQPLELGINEEVQKEHNVKGSRHIQPMAIEGSDILQKVEAKCQYQSESVGQKIKSKISPKKAGKLKNSKKSYKLRKTPSQRQQSIKIIESEKILKGSQYEHYTEYMELNSLVNLIQEMLAAYDECPLYDGEDFESQEEFEREIVKEEKVKIESEISNNAIYEESEGSNLQKGNCSILGEKDDKQSNCPNQNADIVKIQHVSESDFCDHPSRQKDYIVNNESKALEEEFQKMKLKGCGSKQIRKTLRQQKFKRSKLYWQNCQIAVILTPFMGSVTQEERVLFMELMKTQKETKDILDYLEKRKVNRNEHICKMCGEEFLNGRQLGGHMSRRHPGRTFEYNVKKELYKVKAVERSRRQYFKKPKTKLIAK